MMEFLENLGLYALLGFVGLDLVWGARRYEKARWWRLRATVVSALILVLSIGVTLFWSDVFRDYNLFDGSGLGTAAGAVTGILVYELALYWYHRFAHEWNWLWRAGHQMHHSAESLDIFGAYYSHPFDTFVFTTLASLVFFPLLGLTPEAGAIGAAFLGFNAAFQHANIRTPYWLGFIIQRPESHAIHHGRGIHRYNYADLPLWDMAFGTFRNPRSVEGLEAGFYTGASSRIAAMLIGEEVATRPAEGAAAARVSPQA